jgi:hypothetical protein
MNTTEQPRVLSRRVEPREQPSCLRSSRGTAPHHQASTARFIWSVRTPDTYAALGPGVPALAWLSRLARRFCVRRALWEHASESGGLHVRRTGATSRVTAACGCYARMVAFSICATTSSNSNMKLLTPAAPAAGWKESRLASLSTLTRHSLPRAGPHSRVQNLQSCSASSDRHSR